MPRISTSLIRRARALHVLLPLLLPPCRDLPSARNELRWLLEHALLLSKRSTRGRKRENCNGFLRGLCLQRSKGVPLQYLIGNQPFGALEILCEKGVLIPRPETESITHHLAKIVSDRSVSLGHLRILDLCSGTGCISLLLHHLLARRFPYLEILGLDVSSIAVKLANKNLDHNVACGTLFRKARRDVRFEKADILATNEPALNQPWDILVANPPYISPQSFLRDTERSVRKYEPTVALVPPSCGQSDQAIGDSFYPQLLHTANRIQPSLLLVEVADMAQAIRVTECALKEGRWENCEIWRDWLEANHETHEHVMIGDKVINVRGFGNGRAVFLKSYTGYSQQS